MTLLPRRPLPEEHNSPTAWHAAAAWPTLCTRVRGLYRAAPRDAHARTHGPTGLGPGGSPPRVGAVYRAALEGLARSARRLGPARPARDARLHSLGHLGRGGGGGARRGGHGARAAPARP